MIKNDLSFQQIYNLLLAGSQVVLHFNNATEAESFRTRMHHHKAAQQKMLEGLGLMNADERTSLSFKTKKEDNGEAVVALVKFVSQAPLKKYPVLILEQKDIKDAEAEVSGNLGAAQAA